MCIVYVIHNLSRFNRNQTDTENTYTVLALCEVVIKQKVVPSYSPSVLVPLVL